MVGRVRLEVDIEGFELYEQEIIGYLLHECITNINQEYLSGT